MLGRPRKKKKKPDVLLKKRKKIKRYRGEKGDRKKSPSKLTSPVYILGFGVEVPGA